MSTNVTPEKARHGWLDRPRDVAKVVAALPYPIFSMGGPKCMGTEHRDVFFWEQGEIPLLGKLLPAHRQTIGDCVSHGWGRGCQDVVYMQAAGRLKAYEETTSADVPEYMTTAGTFPNKKRKTVGDDGPPVLKLENIRGLSQLYMAVNDIRAEIATEPIYGGSRVEIGGGRIRGDGSVGGWAAKWVNQYGLLQRIVYDEHDLRKYSGSKAKQWGAPRSGVPDELEPTAKMYPVRTVSLVVTDDEAQAALYNMYPIPVCSGQGFTTKRDQYGFCDPRGSWAHCMVARGICLAKRAGKWILAVVIQQSWGESPSGPNKVELKDGRIVELPQGCFLIEFDVFVRMLRGRDSFAVSDVEGFVPRMPNFTL